jgi:hypothetical protein
MLKMQPCPSPRGTNFERLFFVKAPARSPRGQLALDEAPTFKKRGSSAGEEGEGRGVTHPTSSFRVGKPRRLRSRRAGHRVQCGSFLRPHGASGLHAGCCGQASPDDAGMKLDFCLIFAP